MMLPQRLLMGLSNQTYYHMLAQGIEFLQADVREVACCVLPFGYACIQVHACLH
jgi:hypothetical protein